MFRLLFLSCILISTASFAQERSQDSLFADKKYHVIQPKENLYRIAKNYELSLHQLKEINNLHFDLIHPGDTLFLEHQFPATLPQLPIISEKEELPLTEEEPEVLPFVNEEPVIEEEITKHQNLISSLSSTGFLNENMLVMVCVLILFSFLLLFIIIISKKHKREEEELTPFEQKILMEQMNGNQPNPSN